MNIFFIRFALPKALIEINNQIFTKEILDVKFDGLSIDSRAVTKNQIFLALSGQKVDGHDFIGQALANGATCIILDQSKAYCLKHIDKSLLKDIFLVFVQDCLQALVDLAKTYRQKFSYPIVGITGSLGKTTTKEIVAHILKSANIPAYYSFKNQNNLIGLSLNILNLNDSYKVAIFEVGISHVGDMDGLVDILRPDIAAITHISHSHTQGLGRLKDVAIEKKKIFKYFQSNNIGIISGDLKLLNTSSYHFPVIKFGLKTKNHIQARKIKVNSDSINFNLKVYKNKTEVTLSSNHMGLVNNAIAATAIATVLEIDLDTIVKAINSYKSFENRYEKKNLKNGLGIMVSDCCNANPESMKVALLSFDKLKTGKKIAILGDMLELGSREVFWHRQIGRILSKTKEIDHLILVGKLASFIAKTAPSRFKVQFVQDWKEAEQTLKNIFDTEKEQDYAVLFKASNSVGLQNIVKNLSF